MFTTQEAAKRLGVSQRRVNKLAESGQLNAQKFGRDWMIDEDSVNERIATKPRRGRPPLEQEPSNARYILMCHDHEVLALTCNLATGEVRKVEPLSGIDWKPLGAGRLDKAPDRYSLKDWLSHRLIPHGRPHLAKALKEAGVKTSLALMLESGGASLTDPYWFLPLGKNTSWADVNFYKNDYADKLGDILLANAGNHSGANTKISEGNRSDNSSAPLDGSLVAALTTTESPDTTTNGQLAKRWIRRADGDYLIKGGTGNENREPYNEVLATKLFERLLDPDEFVSYDLLISDSRAYSSCKNMVNEATELIPAHDVFTAFAISGGRDTYSEYLRPLESLGVPDASQLIDKMIVVDHLMANFDRHTHNFGLLRDVESRDGYRIAPLFDHGCGFYSRATTAELEARPYSWTSNPFREYPTQQLALVEDLSWYDPTALDGFMDDIEDVLSLNPEIDERFTEAVKRQTMRQIEQVNALAAERGILVPGW